VLDKLLDWASVSIEKSVNQPMLPHAIIALNATDNSIDEKQWLVSEATSTLLFSVDAAIHQVPKFVKHAEYWRSRGKRIHTIKDLLLCFYSTITVVRIPTKGRYMLINRQVARLHQEISTACGNAFVRRQKVRMLCNADDLEVYLQSAFEHFSCDLNKPFDFAEMSLKNNPIPLDFHGNILKLALAIKAQLPQLQDGRKGAQIFKKMSRMVGSCIMLDIARQGYHGKSACSS